MCRNIKDLSTIEGCHLDRMSVFVLLDCSVTCLDRRVVISPFLLLLSSCRDLVSSQRAVSTTTPPSRNFFSTFLPQGRRTSGKTPQMTSGSLPSHPSGARKEPSAGQVKANGGFMETLSQTAKASESSCLSLDSP